MIRNNVLKHDLKLQNTRANCQLYLISRIRPYNNKYVEY